MATNHDFVDSLPLTVVIILLETNIWLWTAEIQKKKFVQSRVTFINDYAYVLFNNIFLKLELRREQ